MERRIRGSVLNAYLNFIKKKWGKVGYEQCLSDLGLDGHFKDGDYYHNEIHENLLRWLSREKGMDSVEDGGKYVVQNLGIIAWLVRFANVRTILERFPKNYSEVYTFGRIEVEDDGSKIIKLHFYDVNAIEEACTAWMGVIKGGLEMTKTVGTVEHNKCACRGDDHCEYNVELEY